MRRKILVTTLLTILGFSTVSFANEDNTGIQSQNNINNQICFAEEVVKDLIKQTLYGLGNQVINKYVGPNYNNNYYNNSGNPTQTNPVNSNLNSNPNNNPQNSPQNINNNIPGQESEQMIPISTSS
ncbi:MAG: hypothetical protein V2B14_03760 [bacterium]